MQATCREMKADVRLAQSMKGYDIKTKHMASMNNFFESKNFELVQNMDTATGRSAKQADS